MFTKAQDVNNGTVKKLLESVKIQEYSDHENFKEPSTLDQIISSDEKCGYRKPLPSVCT